MFERGEGETELILGHKVLDERDDALERGALADKVTPGAQN